MHASMPGVGVRAEPPRQEAQLDREPDEPLLRAVVQVALELAPRGVRRLDDPRPRLLQLRARVDVRDRLPDQLGERVQALLGVGGERRAGAARGHRAPQLSLDHDRRAHARVHPGLAHLLRVGALELLVGVGPRGPAGPLHLLEHRPGVERDRRVDRERVEPGRGPVAQHRRDVRAVEARGHRGVGLQVARDLPGDEVEHLLRAPRCARRASPPAAAPRPPPAGPGARSGAARSPLSGADDTRRSSHVALDKGHRGPAYATASISTRIRASSRPVTSIEATGRSRRTSRRGRARRLPSRRRRRGRCACGRRRAAKRPPPRAPRRSCAASRAPAPRGRRPRRSRRRRRGPSSRATWIQSPARTAALKPIVGANGEGDGTRWRLMRASMARGLRACVPCVRLSGTCSRSSTRSTASR